MATNMTDIIENTIITNPEQENINLILAKKQVFRSYIVRLTRDYLNFVHKLELKKITNFNPAYYHIWTVKRISNIENKITTTCHELFSNILENSIGNSINKPVHIGTLKNIRVLTFNSETNQESNISKDETYNIPASAWLFSSAYSGDSYIKQDWQYESFNYNPLEIITTSKEPDISTLRGNKYGEQFQSAYWHNSYDFSSAYDNVEYNMLDIRKNILPEDRTSVLTDDITYKMEKYSSKIEAILITYDDKEEKNIEYHQPVIYCELHRPTAYMNGKITINWSQNGIISIN